MFKENFYNKRQSIVDRRTDRCRIIRLDNQRHNLPPSLVITTTVELGPGPLGLITCMETRYWVQVFRPPITCLQCNIVSYSQLHRIYISITDNLCMKVYIYKLLYEIFTNIYYQTPPQYIIDHREKWLYSHFLLWVSNLDC